MRCKYCGGEITLEMKYCAHCGKPNEQALEHAQAMEDFQYEFQDTKSDVEEATHKYTGVTVRVVIIAILFVIIIVLLILGGKSYEFRSSWMESKAEKNAAEYMEEMDEMLAEEEFLEFTAFCQEKYIHTYETAYEKYMPVERAALYYQYVYNEIMQVVCPPSYSDSLTELERLSENLDYFYSALDMEQYEYYDNADNEVNRKALAAMEEKVELLLQTYCGISEELAKEFPTMSKGQRAVALEEAVLNEEENK